jgi:hypothetical protein
VARRAEDPVDNQLAERLNAWSDEQQADFKQSLRPEMVKLGWWLAGALTVAVATIHWLV